MNKKKRGFTLIELLVVVLIIGILAAVALPQYQKAVDKASFTCTMTILKSLTDAQTVAALENGGYPPSGHYFTFNDLNITIPVEDQNCLETDLCSIKCSGKPYGIVLRNTETWAGFYFWAGSLERLVYRKGNALPWQLQCVSARCRETAKAFGATDCTGGLCW